MILLRIPKQLTTILGVIILFGVSNFCLFAQDANQAPDTSNTPKVTLPSKEKFRIVVLAGQSNMAGRGFIEDEDKIPIPRVYMLNREGQWVPAIDPVHYDKKSAGVGPGRAFAKLLVDNDPTIAVGLVPTACGGSSIDHWTRGAYFEQTKSHPYDDAVARTKRALEDGELEAILWRQGESDSNAKGVVDYERKLIELFENFRKEFNAPNAPILVGDLFHYKENEYTQEIRRAQKKVVETIGSSAFISAEGAKLNPDKVHFDRESQIVQGERFYQGLVQIKEKQ